MKTVASHIRQAAAEVWVDAAEVDEVPLHDCAERSHAELTDFENIETADADRPVVSHCECRELSRELRAEEVIPTDAEGVAAIESNRRAAVVGRTDAAAPGPHADIILREQRNGDESQDDDRDDMRSHKRLLAGGIVCRYKDVL
jgi:hypothetical protein